MLIISRIYSSANDESNCLNAIADSKAKQRDVARMYADCITADTIAYRDKLTRVDFKKINAAITQRWPKGLVRVKEMAWKLLNPR